MKKSTILKSMTLGLLALSFVACNNSKFQPKELVVRSARGINRPVTPVTTTPTQTLPAAGLSIKFYQEIEAGGVYAVDFSLAHNGKEVVFTLDNFPGSEASDTINDDLETVTYKVSSFCATTDCKQVTAVMDIAILPDILKQTSYFFVMNGSGKFDVANKIENTSFSSAAQANQMFTNAGIAP